MSRVIKFRAWDEAEKWMGEVSSVDFDEGYLFLTTRNSDDENRFDLRAIPLLQFTGLHDKNGAEIYEGDVLLFNNSINDEKWKCVVVHRHGSFVCEYLKDRTYNHFDCWNVPKVSWEVIGNIYENPHLLEMPE